MKTWIAILVAAVGCSFGAGCSSEEAVDERGAAALWEQIQGETYTTWAKAPGWETEQPTVSAHGQTAVVFINDVAAQALSQPSGQPWPLGTLLVKDAYRNGSLAFVSALKKQESGWYFAEWDAGGNAKYAGRPDVCLGCHDGDNAPRAASLP
jgi:hypothetical protein